MDEHAVREALALDAQWVKALRQSWLTVMDEAVWSEIRGTRPGGSGRLRKRVLEMGERLRSLTATREWIPRPREQLKNALASAMAVEEALTALERDVCELPEGDNERLARGLAQLSDVLWRRLPTLKTSWAELLDGC